MKENVNSETLHICGLCLLLNCFSVSIQNMVGAGEVDEDLEVETKEECEKYGKVGKCVIFEVGRFPFDRTYIGRL